VYGVGWLLADAVDGTVAVDNPERPPDWPYDDEGGAGAGSPLDDDEACSAPETIDVDADVDTLLWDAVEEAAGPAALAYPLVVAATWVPLHVGARLAGTERGPVRTLAVGVWGLLPSVLATPPLPVALAVTTLWGGVVWGVGLVDEQGPDRVAAATVAGRVVVACAVVALA
jgi:hypothetical protein